MHSSPFIYGVDFSGARDAGRKIWIAVAEAQGERLHISGCRPAAQLPGGGVSLAQAVSALADTIAQAGPSLWGLDVPVSLPRELIRYDDWPSFIRHFPDDYPSPDTFRERCLRAADGRELKRRCDREARTPFSAYNLRLYRQTYAAMRWLLHPLVTGQRAQVLPMQPGHDGPQLMEVCPASILKFAGQYLPYKGPQNHPQRGLLIDWLMAQQVTIDGALRAELVANAGGDALDSVLAAFGAWRASRSRQLVAGADYAMEGYVYGWEPDA